MTKPARATRSVFQAVVEAGFASADQAKHARIRQANTTSLVLVFVGLLHGSVYLFLENFQVAFSIWAFALAFMLVPMLNHFGHNIAGRAFQPILFSIAVAVMSILVGEESGMTSIFFPGLAVAFLNFDYRETKPLIWTLLVTALLALTTEVWVALHAPLIAASHAELEVMNISSWVVTAAMLIAEIYIFFRSVEISQREVKDSVAVTKSILESLSDSFIFVDRNFRILYMNDVCLTSLAPFGVSDPVGKDYFSIIGVVREDYVMMLVDSMASRTPIRHEYFEPTIGYWVEFRTDPTDMGMSITYRNIDERKRAETERRESEALQQAIFANAGTGLNLLSPEGRYLRVNAEMCRITGYSEEELLGMNFREITISEDHERDSEDIRKLMTGEIAVFSHEKRYIHKSGKTVFINLQLSVIRDELGQVRQVVSAIQDLSQAKEAEQKLLHASKMSSLGEMAGSMAHEINNPLAIIQLSAEQLEDAAMVAATNPEQISKIATRILETVNRVAKIIKGLKTFSRNADQDPLVTTGLSSIADDALELCRERFRAKSIVLRVDGEHADGQIMCRPTEISQVILNLLNNAFDAVESQTGEKWVELKIDSSHAAVSISVTDNGPGMTSAIANRVLEPFFTTKELGKGTGLGLSISKGIAESHGGSLYLDRTSTNTRFVLELPRQTRLTLSA